MSDLSGTEQMRRFVAGLGADPDEIKWDEYEDVEAHVVIKRTLPQAVGIHGHMGSWPLSQFEPFHFDPRDWCDKFFGGGTYRVRLRLPTGRWLKQGTIDIGGDPVTKAEGERRVARHFGIELPDEPEEEPAAPAAGPTIHPVPGLRLPGVVQTPTGFRLPSGKEIAKGEMAEVTRIMQEASSDQHERLIGLLEKKMAKEESGGGGGLAAILANEKIVGAILGALKPTKSDASELFKMFQTMQAEQQKLTTQAQDRAHELILSTSNVQMKMMKDMSTESVRGVIGMLVDVNKAALAAKESGSWVEELPALVEKVMGPIAAGMTPQMPLPTAELPPSLQKPAPGGELPAPAAGEGAPPAGIPAELPDTTQAKAMGVASVFQFLAGLKTCLIHQPDPDDAWEEMMGAHFGMLPATVRTQIEELEDDEYDQVAQILGSVDQINPAWIQDVIAVATSTKGGLAWLASFWECAPWKDEDLADEELPDEERVDEDESAEEESADPGDAVAPAGTSEPAEASSQPSPGSADE